MQGGQTRTKRAAAIVLAAGQGKRMGTASPKQFLQLGGRPVLFYALEAFEKSRVDDVILVTGESEKDYCRQEIIEKYGITKVRSIATGGAERYHSVAMGLEALAKEAGEEAVDLVMIHDGARPFVTPQLIDGLLDETERYPACVTGTPVKDTIKVTDPEHFCMQTPDRASLWSVQTPQSFSFPLILEAYRTLLREEEDLLEKGIRVTDDAMVCELFADMKVKLVPGDYLNLKLTTPEDLLLAERIMEIKKQKIEER